MERRLNTVKANWLWEISKHILKNQKKIKVMIDRREDDKAGKT